MTLNNFPRGGRKPQSKTLSDSLFHKKKSNKRPQKKKLRDNKSNTEASLVASSAERLSYFTLQEGLIILGRINKVTEYDLIVSLPGGMKARLQVTDICESYTNLLQNIIKTEGGQPEEFKPLPELYNVGQYVVCYVKSIKLDEKCKVNISLEPQLINQNLDNTRFIKDSIIVCTISSVEDHCYVVDTGIANVRAFITKKDVDNEAQCFPGKQLFCCIKQINTAENVSTIKLTAKQKRIENVVTDDIQHIDSLTPGTKVQLKVEKILSNGLQVSFGENNVGYINQLYLNSPLSSYVTDMVVDGTLLYIMPTVKFAYFSLLSRKPEKKTFNIGDIIPNACVLYRQSNDIILNVPSGVRCLIPIQKTAVDYDEVPTKFKPGSTHKCRVLAYNWMDQIYVCSAQREVLEQKYFSSADFTPGDIVNVDVVNVKPESESIVVRAGKTIGYIEAQHVSDHGSDALNNIKVGDKLKARVLSVNEEKNKVHFTLKDSLVNSEYPILCNIKDAKCGSEHHGTIVFRNKNGLLVKFFGDVKGWIPQTDLNKLLSTGSTYSIGQVVLVKIETVAESDGKMTLSIVQKNSISTNTKFIVGETVEGIVLESSVEGVTIQVDENNEGGKKSECIAFLPAGHMSLSAEVARLLASKCVPGDTISAQVFATTPHLLLTKTFLPSENCINFDSLKVGDCIPCSVKEITENGIKVILPVTNYAKLVFIPSNKVTNFELIQEYQVLFAKIVSINKKQAQVMLTMELKKVWIESNVDRIKMMTAIDVLSLHLYKLSDLAKTSYYKSKPISSVKLGQKVNGEVEKVTDHGLVLKLQNGLHGTVRKDHYSGTHKKGDKVSGAIIWINHVHELVDVTLLPKLINDINAHQNELPPFDVGVQFRGQIIMITDWFILAVLKGHGHGCLVALPARRHVNDLQPDLRPYAMWSKIRCYVVLNKSECSIMPICMLKSAFEEPKPTTHVSTTLSERSDTKRKSTVIEENKDVVSSKKMKLHVETPSNDLENKVNTTQTESQDDEPTLPKSLKKKTDKKEVKVKKKKIEEDNSSCKRNTKRKLQNENSDTEESEEEDIGVEGRGLVRIMPNNKENNRFETMRRLPECGFSWDNKNAENSTADAETSSDSEEEDEAQPKTKKKKLSAAERREQERQKEREIRQREEALASNEIPNSVDQFDRLVLSSPDSSLIWLQYMAYHLQATEFEKARAVARRAIKTINFREENERLNVWNAWLNLESKFGTAETLNDVFQEAIRTNDPLKIYTHMLTVHIDAGRHSELEKTINTMISKFKQDPQVWIECGAAFLKVGLKEKSRHIMQRALQSLPATHHVNLMVRFAHLENKIGDKERAQTLFEQILSSYPKRVDVWTSYTDALIKSQDFELARKVLERATVQTLPPRKMKTLFKKFISFEEQHGTPEGVARVQQMAAEYVENQCNKLSLDT